MSTISSLLLYLIVGCLATFFVIPSYIAFLYRHNL